MEEGRRGTKGEGHELGKGGRITGGRVAQIVQIWHGSDNLHASNELKREQNLLNAVEFI